MHLVVGATGRLGGALTVRLLARGERVRVLVRPRDPDRDQVRALAPEQLIALGAELDEGDLTKPDTVTTPDVAARFGLRTSGIDAFIRRSLAS